MTTLRFNDDTHQLLGLGLLAEAGVGGMPIGGCELVVDDDYLSRLDVEQQAELDRLTRDPLVDPEIEAVLADPVRPEFNTAPAGTEAAVNLALPPRTGPGSGRDAWAAAAVARKIPVTDTMTRDDIIRAVEAHGDS